MTLVINNTQLAILEAVGRFQYMTVPQLMAWGVTRNQRHLYAVLSGLEGKTASPLRKMSYGAIAGVGRLHSIYHLSGKGADILRHANVDEINYPKKPVMFTRDYFHRIDCIDVHIAVEKWARENNGAITRFLTYFNQGHARGGNPTASTTVKWSGERITPDLVVMLAGSDQKERLCAIELHRGKDLLRLEKQVLQYARAIEVAAIENAFDYPAAARVLLIFTEASALQTFMQRPAIAGLSENTKRRLFLGGLETVKRNWLHGWQNLQGEPVALF